MAANNTLVDAVKLDLTSLKIDDVLPIPAAKPQQKAHKVNNLNRTAAVEVCTRTLVLPNAVKVGLAFLFIYFKDFCFFTSLQLEVSCGVSSGLIL